MKRLFASLLLIGALASGCAYYNTFFHAKEFYADAERARRRVPEERRAATGLDLYEQSMKKCAKVILEYPDSKWVDDAVLLMGKCMYAKGDYLAAIRKFEELSTVSKDKKLLAESRYYKAQTLLELERYKDAMTVLESIGEKEKSGYRKQATYLLAKVQFKQGEYEAAVEGLEEFLKSGASGTERGDALLMLGEAYANLGETDLALDRYEERLGIVTLHETERLDTMLRMAAVLRDADNFDDAYDLLYQTRVDVTAKSDSIRIAHEIGRTLEKEGRFDEAARLYYENLASAPPGDESGRLAFSLGELQLYQFNRKDSASTAFSKVAVLAQDPELKKESVRIASALSEHLSLQARFNTSEVDTAEIEFLLGENAYFHFKEAKNAYNHYDRVTTYYPNSDYAPLAKAAKAYLIEAEGVGHENPDSLRKEVIREYPRSSLATELLDMRTIRVPEDSLQQWIARYDAVHGAPEEAKKEAAVRQFGRVRVFPGEGEVEVPDTTKRVFAGPPGPVRIIRRVEPDYPRGTGLGSGEVEVEVDVDGFGRVRDARVMSSTDPAFEGPALAAAYQCEFIADGAEGTRQTIIRFPFRPRSSLRD
ncbi:MAG: tetratricopeptide repeat protein [Gemmatimonadetes bacterium]|nr:tetratricopeptide repeat protein [Gemmatimonadota bacterium]